MLGPGLVGLSVAADKGHTRHSYLGGGLAAAKVVSVAAGFRDLDMVRRKVKVGYCWY